MGSLENSAILIIDDIAENRLLLTSILQSRGFNNLTQSPSGKDALNQLQASNSSELPDLILLDVMMPEMDGFELTKILKSTESLRLIPIILVTALGSRDDRIKGIEAGCDDFISKPFDFNEVVARIKTSLKTNFYRQQVDEKQKLSAVLANMSDAVITCKSDWIVTWQNSAADHYFGSIDSLTSCFFNHISSQFVLSEDKESILANTNNHFSFTITRAETNLHPPLILEVVVDKIMGIETISSLIISIRNITDQRLDWINRDDLLNFVSHKFQTPLQIIKDSTDLLQSDIDLELKSSLLEMITKNTSILTQLMKRILIYGSLNQDAGATNCTPLEINAFLDNYGKGVSKRYPNIEINITPLSDTHYIQCIESKCTLVLNEIIDNSVKFKSSIIHLSIATDATVTTIKIVDNGIGISPEELNRIERPLYQSEKLFTGMIDGFGMGLAIVKKAMQLMGGTITIESQTHSGTAVYLSFLNSSII